MDSDGQESTETDLLGLREAKCEAFSKGGKIVGRANVELSRSLWIPDNKDAMSELYGWYAIANGIEGWWVMSIYSQIEKSSSKCQLLTWTTITRQKQLQEYNDNRNCNVEKRESAWPGLGEWVMVVRSKRNTGRGSMVLTDERSDQLAAIRFTF